MKVQEPVPEDRARAVDNGGRNARAGAGVRLDDDTTVEVDPQKRRTRRVLIGAAIGLVLIVLISAFALRRERAATTASEAAAAAPAAPAPAAISTATATVRELPVFVVATGSLTPYESTDVAPEVDGQVVATPVDVGDYVRRGTVLARLDDRDARLRLQQAEAALQQAEANVRQTREKLGRGPDGRLDPTRVAEVEMARAQMQLAEVNEGRYRNLVETGDVARATYDDARVRAETARRQYEAALAAARSGTAGVDVASASAQSARAEVGLAKKAVADSVIVAPFDGHIAERPTAAGEWVTTASKIASIVQTGVLKLLLNVSESDASLIRVGMSVGLTVDAYPDREFRGQVGAIVPSLDASSRSLVAVVGVPNPDNVLRPGMFATARVLQPSEGRRGVVVPRAAVVAASGASSRVFVIKDNRAEARVVQLGQEEDGFVHIISGVNEGEDVAVAGVDGLTDGAPVVR